MSYTSNLIRPVEQINVSEVASLLARFATSKMKIRTIIADDMPLARSRIKRFLKTDSEIEIICECSSGTEAIEAINRLKPDLVFLDVEMPGISGFEVLQAIKLDPMPVVIFATAYDKFTLRAFDFHVLDYLLKPFDEARLKRSLERAKRELKRTRKTDINQQLQSVLQNNKSEQKFLKRIAVKSGERTVFLPTEDIDWVATAGNYVELHVGKQTHLIRERMCELEAKLDGSKFVRIHRLSLINIERVRELQPLFNGDYIVILQNGVRLTLSRTYREKLFDLIEGK
ncbi:MAG: LytTR family DNA-binding domain-containing protein [Acidobacteriota bacterium]|nr:LytTR family DNA-binding domain-containing protein [Acidobacteriota bacterium]